MEESFYRPPEVARESRHLPAALYNLARVLLAREPRGCLFVPIRSMQYLAVLDDEEFIFVPREGGRLIELAWQRFRPAERSSLEAPVPYEVAYYQPAGRETMRRLIGDFRRALELLDHRRRPAGRHRPQVLPFPGREGA